MKQFLEEWLLSWSGNRPQELLKFYHPDIFYSDPAMKEGITGKANLEKYLVKLLAKYPDWKWSLVHFDVVSENRLYVKWEFSLHNTTALARGLDLLEIKDGLIIRNEVYFDTKGVF